MYLTFQYIIWNIFNLSILFLLVQEGIIYSKGLRALFKYSETQHMVLKNLGLVCKV